MVATQQVPKPQSSKMSLQHLVKGKLTLPTRTLLYGVEGIGKTTFASGAPKPIFLGAEDGSSQLDVSRFQSPETWEHVRDALRVLTLEQHDFGTLVLDTADWAEPLLWDFICRRDKEKSIESYGYGKGYVAALDEWRVFLADLERLRAAKRMHVVILAHSWIKPFKNPEGDDYDRYELKLHPKAAGLMKEWVDTVLFANYQTFAVENEKTKRVKGVSDGTRLIYTNRTPAYDAKNRYGLPSTLPLSWEDYWNAVQAGQPQDPAVLRAEIQRKSAELGGDIQTKTAELLEQFGNQVDKLSQLNNRLNAKLSERQAQQSAPAAQ